MMEVIQWCFNLGMLGYVMWNIYERLTSGSTGDRSQFNEMKENLLRMEARLTEWEKEFKNSQAQFVEKLKSIDTICEQANRILKSTGTLQGSFPPSQEETELKEAMHLGSPQINPSEHQIPSLRLLDGTKKRLQKETELDLRTLLTHQLA